MATDNCTNLILRAENLIVRYGKVIALQGVSLEVFRGELVALLGANGAGKTTLLKSIMGVLSPQYGRIDLLDCQNAQDLPPHKISQLGVAWVPEAGGVFSQMTVHENLLLAQEYSNRAEKGVIDEMYDRFPILKERRKQLAGTLSGGERQMLAIARAWARRPYLILLDEPSLGLAPQMVAYVFEMIQNINAEGITILLVEQNTKTALKVSQRAYVLRVGTIAFAGSISEIQDSRILLETYLGQ